ncbi:MAG: hypothetical protein JWQ40_1403 [Segetibacter sp.]|nr:hypothetical protein [Segetibacter sp.]
MCSMVDIKQDFSKERFTKITGVLNYLDNKYERYRQRSSMATKKLSTSPPKSSLKGGL